MIKKIYKKLFTAVRNSENYPMLSQHMNANIHALNSLNNLFGTDFNKYIPFTDYALSPYSIAHILNDLAINLRKNIVEFGSGTSTIYVALFLQKHSAGQTFISFDQDAAWQQALKSNYLNGIPFNKNQHIKLIHAPLKITEYGKQDESKWYCEETVNKNIEKKVDCIIVDGPTGDVNKYSRYPVINFIANNLTDNGVVFVDDAYREDETVLIRELVKNHGFKKSSTLYHTVLSKGPSYFTRPIGDYLSQIKR